MPTYPTANVIRREFIAIIFILPCEHLAKMYANVFQQSRYNMKNMIYDYWSSQDLKHSSK